MIEWDEKTGEYRKTEIAPEKQWSTPDKDEYFKIQLLNQLQNFNANLKTLVDILADMRDGRKYNQE